MNNIQVFQSEQFGQIRTAVTEGGEPLLAATDVARSLGYTNPQKAIRDHCKGVNETFTPTESGVQGMKFIPESDVYRLIMRSKLPTAEKFQDWACEEVFPALRKTGGYMVARADETPEQLMARALKVAEDTLRRTEDEKQRLIEQNNLSRQTIEAQAPKVRAFDEVISSEGLITTNKIALDLGTSAIMLNRALCERRIQYKEGGTYLLYSKYRDKGYAVLRPCPYVDELGRPQTRQHLYWTERGRLFIHNLMKTT
jgi:prophage antirepressor-like protein